MGLTSSSWPWSHPTHLWTCIGCSCPQSGKQRDCLKWAIREGALMCLAPYLRSRNQLHLPSHLFPLPSSTVPTITSVAVKNLCCFLSTYSHSFIGHGDDLRGDTTLICADRMGILSNMAQGCHSTQVLGCVTKAEGSLSLCDVCRR